MRRYEFDWTKWYTRTGTMVVHAENSEQAMRMAERCIGDQEGSLQYQGSMDEIELVNSEPVEVKEEQCKCGHLRSSHLEHLKTREPNQGQCTELVSRRDINKGMTVSEVCSCMEFK